jgi:hypothetical protein
MLFQTQPHVLNGQTCLLSNPVQPAILLLSGNRLTVKLGDGIRVSSDCPLIIGQKRILLNAAEGYDRVRLQISYLGSPDRTVQNELMGKRCLSVSVVLSMAPMGKLASKRRPGTLVISRQCGLKSRLRGLQRTPFLILQDTPGPSSGPHEQSAPRRFYLKGFNNFRRRSNAILCLHIVIDGVWSMSCAHLSALQTKYQRSVDEYVVVVEKLRGHEAGIPQVEFMVLWHAAEIAKDKSIEAQRIVEHHIADHSCCSPSIEALSV